MSYDLYFWRQTTPLPLTPADAGKAILTGTPPEGIADVPLEAISKDLKEVFPDFNPEDRLVRTKDGSIAFAWGQKHFVAHVYGVGDATGTVVQILGRHGFPAYDDQLDKRYDAAEGTAVGTPPEFRSPTAEETAAKQQMLREVAAAGERLFKQKKGCFGLVLAVALPPALFALFRFAT